MLLPSRPYFRCRFNSTRLFEIGFNVLGSTYRLNYFNSFTDSCVSENSRAYGLAQDLELRRSEVRIGARYMRSIKGFFRLIADACYRMNWSYDIDRDGDFVCFFDDDAPSYIENYLGNHLYLTVEITYVSSQTDKF